jgi:hypothetical protein
MKPDPGDVTACELQSQLCRSVHHKAIGKRLHGSDVAAGLVGQLRHRGPGRDTTYGRYAMASRTASTVRSARCSTTRVPWRALGLGSSAIGGIAAAYYSHPLVGLAVVICETSVAVIIVATALFGSATMSDRAFRLLRWFSNRPEPDAPPTVITRPPREGDRRRRRP